MLGAWNRGSHSERQGLFLSMFYALQNKNPNEPNHPWNENVHDWDRGVGAHIDYWLKHKHNKPYYLYAYDHANPPTRRATIIGRKSTEAPFNAISSDVIGRWESGGSIYIKTDFNLSNGSSAWALGHRMDEPYFIPDGTGQSLINISYIIAHEVGHFLGFEHICSSDSIMYAGGGTLPSDYRPRWQTPAISNQLFEDLADKVNT
jgi:hypothetical protein